MDSLYLPLHNSAFAKDINTSRINYTFFALSKIKTIAHSNSNSKKSHPSNIHSSLPFSSQGFQIYSLQLPQAQPYFPAFHLCILYILSDFNLFYCLLLHHYMFSIPSTECQFPQEELKELNNLSLTNCSSESDPTSSPTSKKESNKIDWLNVADSVFGWFQAKTVTTGDLESLIHEQRTKQKKYKAEKMLQEDAVQLDSIFNRRLSRRLTISI